MVYTDQERHAGRNAIETIAKKDLDSNDLELAIVLFISLQCPCPPPGKRAFPPLSSGNDAAYICQEEIQLTGPS
jgi:hypothetical protein